jgi:hypothetical protein
VLLHRVLAVWPGENLVLAGAQLPQILALQNIFEKWLDFIPFYIILSHAKLYYIN